MYGILLVATALGVAIGCPPDTTPRAAAAVTVPYPEALDDAATIVLKIERALDGEATLDWGRLDSDLNEATRAVSGFLSAHPEDLPGRLLQVRLGRLLDLVQPVPVTMDSTGVHVGGNLNRHADLHADLDRILAEAPGLSEALYLKARLYATRHPIIDEHGFSIELNWPAALECAEEALELVPTERRYRELYALGLSHLGRPDSALAALEHGGLEDSLLGRLWRDLGRIPIPSGATRDADTESTMAEMLGSQIGPYGSERVRAYKVADEATELETLFRSRWPDFAWIRSEGEAETAMQFLRVRKDDYQPVRSEDEGEKYANRGEGIMLMTMVRDPAPGFEDKAGRVLMLVNYRRE
jgi:tetratricopeptide (TPR) repeat protein